MAFDPPNDIPPPMPPEDTVPEIVEMPETDPPLLDRFLTFINPKDRRGVLLFVLLAALAVGIVDRVMIISARADDAIDARIETKAGPRLNDLEKRATAVESDAKDTRGQIGLINTNIAQIRQILDDRLPVRPR